MKNIVVTTQGEFIVADIVKISDWDGFDILEKYLVEYFDAIILEKVIGPESKICVFQIQQSKISLHNNPYGNYLKINKNETMKSFTSIINNLEMRLLEI